MKSQRIVLALSLCIAVALTSVAVSAAAPRVKVVKATGSQPALRIDKGRSLARAPLTGKTTRAFLRRARLSPIEKARLDGRRLLRASSMPELKAVSRVLHIVQQRLRYPKMSIYDAFVAREAKAGKGVMNLSRAVAERIGICREQAFLVVEMLAEGGIDATVQYGKVYDNGRDLGGHAWVRATIGGKPVRIDLNAPTQIEVSPKRIKVEEVLQNGSVRNTWATTGTGRSKSLLVYVPTNDLVYE